MIEHRREIPDLPPLPSEKQMDQDLHRGRLIQIGTITGAIVVSALAILFAARAQDQADVASVATNQRDAAVAQKDDLAERAIALCSAGGPELEKLRAVGLCQKAVEAQQEQPETPTPEVPFALVRDAVEAYLAANPPRDGKTPTPAELVPIVQQVYRDNPPKDGKTPSDAEILAVIREVYAANPPAAGKDGEDGRNAPCIAADADRPTADQCRGPAGQNGADGADGRPGTDGQAGVSVTAARAATRDGICYLDFTLSDGSVISAEVSPRVCEQPVPLVPRPTR